MTMRAVPSSASAGRLGVLVSCSTKKDVRVLSMQVCVKGASSAWMCGALGGEGGGHTAKVGMHAGLQARVREGGQSGALHRARS